MGQVIPIQEDYSTPCGVLPVSFIQMLAACMVNYSGHTYLNAVGASVNCDTLTSFWTCANNGTDPERALVENLFALDECDNMAIKLILNQGAI